MGKATTVNRAMLGKKELRLVEQDGHFYGRVDGRPCVDGEDADDVWRRLHDKAGSSDPRYFGFDGARNRFLRIFPDGFRSPRYREKERDYKLAAKARLDRTVPLENAAEGSGHGEAVLAVFRATDLLSPFEKTRLQNVLHGPHADEFVRATARFTLDGGRENLLAMERALKPQDSAKWTVITYLPFLWRPDRHMFLKPQTTKDFAVRVGHRFADEYEARLRLPIYERLLDLVERTEAELAELEPRDRIDIQSFIWVVGNYPKEEEEKRA